MKGEELQALLARQLEDGVKESTASFTIDSLRARRKLASSQLPEHGLWLVKLIQAAVVAEAKEICISFGKRRVEFQFRCPGWKWEPRRIMDLLLSGELPTEPFLYHLLAGLRGSILDDTLAADWTVSRPEGRFQVLFAAEGTELLEEEGENVEEATFVLRTSRPPRWPGLRKAASMPVKHLLRRTAEEFMAVQNHCWCCPVPIRLDGRLLEFRYRPGPAPGEMSFLKLSQQMGTSSPLSPLPNVIVRRELDLGPGQAHLELPWAEDFGPREHSQSTLGDVSAKKTVHLEENWLSISLPVGERVGGCLLILYGMELESRIEFLCDGAVVDTAPLPWQSKRTEVMGRHLPQNAFKIGVRVLLPVSTEELDLSHFSVREAESLAASRQLELRRIIQETVQYCLDQRATFRFRYAPRPTSALKTVSSTVIGTLVNLHPAFYIMIRTSFKSELNSLLKAVQ